MAAPDLLATFQKHIEDMRNLSLCKICIKPFYEPFILPCGHTYCYSCLASWFGGATGRRSKSTCPDCRANVRVEPSPNYLLRDLVHMFIGRAELLPEDETVQEHQTAKEEEAVLLAADRAGPGLFKGVFLGLGSARGPRNWRSGILDPEDNVWRCPECHWELEDGGCSRCGFHQFDVAGSDSDSDVDESIDLDESEMDDEGSEIDHEFGTTMGEHAFHIHFPDTSIRRHPVDEEEEEYSDEDDDMDGFIDNEVEEGDSDSDADTESTMTIYNRQLRNQQDNDHPSVSSGVSHEGDPVRPSPYDPYYYPYLESDAHSTVHTSQSTNGDQSDAATNYDEMTEASDVETTPAQPAQPARRLGARRVVLSSDDEDEDEPRGDGSGTADHSAEDRQEDHEDEHDLENEVDSLASMMTTTTTRKGPTLIQKTQMTVSVPLSPQVNEDNISTNNALEEETTWLSAGTHQSIHLDNYIPIVSRVTEDEATLIVINLIRDHLGDEYRLVEEIVDCQLSHPSTSNPICAIY